jgi:lipid II:glycine glycyltransferase (peptidoglycan interpeptide bridge formation enzyme)
MKLKLQILNPIDYAGWDDLVLSSSDHSFFHSSNWAKVICDSYNYKPTYFTLIDSEGLKCLIPFMEIRSFITGCRGVSLPFSDSCQPIVTEKNGFKDLLDKIIHFGISSGWNHIEFRGGESFFEGISPSSHYYSHILKLTQNEEDVLSSFRDSTRRNIRKASKKGVEIKILNTLESIKEFYRLNCLTRKQHSLPPQPFYFFKNIYDHIISKECGVCILAFYQEQAIAGAIFFHFGEKAVYKYGASDSAYQHLRGNNLVMWSAIKLYSQRGFCQFDFGRTEPENNGLRQFKTGWGTRERTLSYFKYDLKKDTFITNSNRISGSYNRIFYYMPLPFLKLIGSLAYRHIG